jgi:hypothetical protein
MEQGERGRALAGGRSSERHGWSFERDPGGVGHEETESGRKKKQRRGEEIRSKVWGPPSFFFYHVVRPERDTRPDARV